MKCNMDLSCQFESNKYSLKKFIRIEYYINPNNSFDHIQKRISLTWTVSVFYREPSSDLNLTS